MSNQLVQNNQSINQLTNLNGEGAAAASVVSGGERDRLRLAGEVLERQVEHLPPQPLAEVLILSAAIDPWVDIEVDIDVAPWVAGPVARAISR